MRLEDGVTLIQQNKLINQILIWSPQIKVCILKNCFCYQKKFNPNKKFEHFGAKTCILISGTLCAQIFCEEYIIWWYLGQICIIFSANLAS